MYGQKERLNQAYEYIKSQKIISVQKDVAEKMNSTQQNVSGALNGNEKILTTRFLKRFAEAFPDIDPTWLLTGEGEMLRPSATADRGGVAIAGNATANRITTNATPADATELQYLREQNEILKSQLRDKERIIRLLEEKK